MQPVGSESLHRSLTRFPDAPLAGRDRELAVLRDTFSEVRNGQSRLVLLSGDAGVGKTALVRAFASSCIDDGALVLTGHSHDLSATPPYGPWQELLQQAQRQASVPGTSDRVTSLTRTEAVPGFPALVADVLAYLTLLAARQPLVLVLEDAHWSDPASLDLLRAVVRDARTLPILFIVTYRADDLAPDHHLARLEPILVRETNPVRIALRPLAANAVEHFLRSRFKLDDVGARRLFDYLELRAEGNPFFIQELLFALADTGRLTATETGVHVGDLSQVAVPPLLRQVIGQRLARLSPDTRQCLAIAAVIGQEVSLDVWQQVASLDQAALFTVTDEAVAARLLTEVPDGSAVRFTHALLREVLYDGTLAARRRVWHSQIAEILIDRSRPASAPDPDAIAYHLRQSGDDRAVEWLVRAGDHAQQAFAERTAVVRFEDALTLLAKDERRSEMRCELLLRLGRLYRRIDFQKAVACLDEAAVIATRAGDAVLVAVALFRLGWVQCYSGNRRHGLINLEHGLSALDALPATEVARVAPIDSVCASFAARHGSYALRLAEVGCFLEATMHANSALAHPATGALDRHDAKIATAVIARAMGQPDEARRLDAEMYAFDRRVDDHDAAVWLATNELAWAVLSFWTDDRVWLQQLQDMLLGRVPQPGELFHELPGGLPLLPLSYLHGDWEQVRQVSSSLQQLHLATHPFAQIVPLVLGQIALAQGDPETARNLVRQELPAGSATQPGDNRILTSLAMQRLAATLALDAGDLTQARAWIQAHDRWLAWSGAILGHAAGQQLWARCFRAGGDLPAARSAALAALAAAQRPRQPLVQLVAHRFLGELDSADGRFEDAVGALQQALDLAEECAAPYERGLTLLAIAELHAATGDRGAALAAITQARLVLVPLDATPALQRANVLTTQLAERAAHGPPAGLTEREVAVLRLLASGRSNREIGQALGITTRTAERHVGNIYLKIDAGGRADATAFAIRNDLLAQRHDPPT